MNTVCVRTAAVPLAGVFGLVIVPCTEHDWRDPGAAAPLALRPICEGHRDLLQSLSRGAEEARSAPAAHRGRGRRLHEGLDESHGPDADGPHLSGEDDGALEVEQGDVVVVRVLTGIVARVHVLLQHVIILLCALVYFDVMLPCMGRGIRHNSNSELF